LELVIATVANATVVCCVPRFEIAVETEMVDSNVRFGLQEEATHSHVLTTFAQSKQFPSFPVSCNLQDVPNIVEVSDGTLPIRRLFWIWRALRTLRDENSLGIVPVNLLSFSALKKKKSKRLVSRAKATAEQWATHSEFRATNRPSWLGIVLSRDVLNNDLTKQKQAIESQQRTREMVDTQSSEGSQAADLSRNGAMHWLSTYYSEQDQSKSIENSSKLRQLRNGTDKTLSAVNCPMSVEMVPVVNATSAKSLR
jgi:hypothetical protein